MAWCPLDVCALGGVCSFLDQSGEPVFEKEELARMETVGEERGDVASVYSGGITVPGGRRRTAAFDRKAAAGWKHESASNHTGDGDWSDRCMFVSPGGCGDDPDRITDRAGRRQEAFGRYSQLLQPGNGLWFVSVGDSFFCIIPCIR